MIELIELKARASIRTNTTTDHIFIVDVSSSMSTSLKTMREHLKNNISTIIKQNDTISIIYFSGKNQSNIIVKKHLITNNQDHNELNNSIDKYLKPICLTGFVDPLVLAIDILKDCINTTNIIFMTDGYDNEYTKKQILDTCKKVKCDKATIIEYGNYCDRNLLSEMATIMGANHIFTDSLTDMIDKTSLSFKVNTVPKYEVTVAKNAIAAIYLDPYPVVVNIENQIALIPESISNIYSITKNKLSLTKNEDLKYISLWYSLHTHDAQLLWESVNVLGDIRIFNAVENAFTKQELQHVKTLVEECIVDKTKRFECGYAENLVPKENAYTILNFLNDITKNNIKINISSFEFYRSGSKKRESENTDNITFIPYAKKFIDSQDIVFNESRPNISLLTTKEGYVKIPLQKQKDFSLPGIFETFIHRNYTIIRDGIINVKELLLEKTDILENLLDKHSIQRTYFDDTVIIDLTKIPLVNRNMMKNLNLRNFLNAKILMLEYKADYKILKEMRMNLVGLTSSSNLHDKYGKEATEYLNSIGIRDYGYGSLPTKTVETTDYYVSTELETKIPTSTFSKTTSVLEKQANNKKINFGDSLILQAYNKFKYLNIDEIKQEEKRVKELLNKMTNIISETTYSLLISKNWFNDTDESTLDINYKGYTLKCSVQVVNKNIPI